MNSKLEPAEALPKAVLDRAREIDTSSSDWLQSVFGSNTTIALAVGGAVCVAIGAATFIIRAKRMA